MAVKLSTVDTIGQLTGTQHRALNQVLGVADDYVIDSFGGKLATAYSGWNITTQTGMIILNGTLVEVDNDVVNTFDPAGVSGTAMVIAKVNLSTKVASIELKKGTTLTQNNLISSLTGIREVELYRFTHSASAITGFTDKRVLKSNAVDTDTINLVNDIQSDLSTVESITNNIKTDLTPAKTAGGVFLPVEFNSFKPSATTELITTYPQTIPMGKTRGGLNIASNLITLPKGYIYHFTLNLYASSGTGFAIATVMNNANGDNLLDTGHLIVQSTETAGKNNVIGIGVVDLTGATSNMVVKVVNTTVAGTVTIQTSFGSLEVVKYIKIPFTNL